jgi:hypothetical protein
VKDINSASADATFGMLTDGQKNMPAPWVPFTRAGCDVGNFSIANTVIERVGFDVPKIFGAGSSQALEDTDHQNADFEGEAVHCAAGSPICSTLNGGVADLLPDEPNHYNGFNALFGAKYIALATGGPLKDLDGNVIQDPVTHLTGFPGFSPSASQTLGAVATMLEARIPVTFAYIADAHDDRVAGLAFGPGAQGYHAQLVSYDQAFGKFFKRLADDGINQSNTLFIFTADEGDHFIGGPPNAPCDGVTTFCTYSKIGEITFDLSGVLLNILGISTPFSIHADDAPAVYVNGNPQRTDPNVRQLEQAIGQLTAVSPITGKTDTLTAAMADPVGLKLLHNGDAGFAANADLCDVRRSGLFLRHRQTVLFGAGQRATLSVRGPGLCLESWRYPA